MNERADPCYPGVALRGVVLSVLEHIKNVFCQGLFNFAMARNGLADTCSRVLIPIMAPAVSNEGTAFLLDLTDEVTAFHGSCNSATRRTSGMLPLVSS